MFVRLAFRHALRRMAEPFWPLKAAVTSFDMDPYALLRRCDYEHRQMVNELVFLHRKSPSDVAAWLSDEAEEVARRSVRMLRAFIEQKDGGVLAPTQY